MSMSLTQLGADLLWNPGSVTAEQVRSEIATIAALPLPDEVKRSLCNRLRSVLLALEAAYDAMGKVAKDVHELAWHVDNGDAESFKLSAEGQ